MELPIPNKIRSVWDFWDIRFCILLSLCLQVFLVFFASLRQRSRSTLLLMLIWSAYLVADWVAAVTIGLITKTQADPCRSHGRNEYLYAFWASFLLLHLGGPDSITSFALEDNEFWLRHLFGLVLHVLGASYSFFLTVPTNNLWPPTILVLFVGTVKYAERTMALYLASLERFGATVFPQPYPGPDYEEAVAIYSTIRSVQVPELTEITLMPNDAKSKDPKFDFTLNCEFDQLELLQVAYSLFESFKGLIVGILLSSKLRESSQKLFLHRTAKSSFRLIEFELSFMFQVLHTKVVVARSRIGFAFRCISFCFMLGAFTLFHFLVEKHEFGDLEVSLTYALLIGAVGLDIISGFKLIFSDWILISNALNKFKKCIPHYVLEKRRWSGSVSQYNMIGYCLDEHWIWNYKLPDCVRGMVDKIKIMQFSSSDSNIEDLKLFIFNELRMKSSKTNSLSDAMEACSQRGDWALLGTNSYIKLKWSVSEFQYAESLLLWHLATEICYHQNVIKSTIEEDDKLRRICKLISDYMFYLLIMKPVMLAPVLGNWHIVFQDTFAETKRYLMKYSISDHKIACNQLINVKTKFRPAAVKGIKSKSVLFDACILSQQLQHLKEEKWKLMSSVWVELMSYGAINCRPIVHAQQPSKGGELLTQTWLLMNHLGLGSQFYEQEQQAGTKVLAVK